MSYLKRSLCYQQKNPENQQLQQFTISEDALPIFKQPLLILGEAGMGKSSLLERLATTEGYVYCRARQLVIQHDPKTILRDQQVILIDALDEMSASQEGQALDQVLIKLGELDYPQFVIACRVADWRSATGLQVIQDLYPDPPLELYLNPLTEQDIEQLLAQQFAGATPAQAVMAHFQRRGLEGVLSNPQTLKMLVETNAQQLPESLTQLFEQATEKLAHEHSDIKAREQLPKNRSLDCAGAAFASLILTANEAISRKALANVSDTELPITDINVLPDGDCIDECLDTRLFRPLAAERFSYQHRRIGEFLAAKWLRTQANTDSKRERLLALFDAYVAVPANLRGLHAWLSQDPALALRIIQKDPLGVLEYADPASFNPAQARVLLTSIRSLAEENPHFQHRQQVDIRALNSPDILAIMQADLVQSEQKFGYRFFITESIKKFQLSEAFIQILQGLVLDLNAEYALRKSAAEALAAQHQTVAWQQIYEGLAAFNDEDSIRLSIELLEHTGDDKVTNQYIADQVFDYIQGVMPITGPVWILKNRLPTSRACKVLDHFTVNLRAMDSKPSYKFKRDAKDFAYCLIVRVLETPAVTAETLWRWLAPFAQLIINDRDSTGSAALHEYFMTHPQIKQQIQYWALLGGYENHQTISAHRLRYVSSGLQCSNIDVIALLNQLFVENSADPRWRDLLQLVPHDGELGGDVREAALPFTQDDPDAQQWLSQIATRNLANEQLDEIENDRKQAIEKNDNFRYNSNPIMGNIFSRS